jgi:hypothetical protein
VIGDLSRYTRSILKSPLRYRFRTIHGLLSTSHQSKNPYKFNGSCVGQHKTVAEVKNRVKRLKSRLNRMCLFGEVIHG